MTSTSKYKNEKVTLDGYTFDSKLEAERYSQLKLLLRAKEITNLTLQPEYVLIPSFKKHGKTYRQLTYIADFSYTNKNGNTIVEDVKGMQTDVFKIKYKLFEYFFPELELHILTKKDI